MRLLDAQRTFGSNFDAPYAGSGKTNGDTNGHWRQPLPRYLPQQPAPFRAKRETDANLAAALRHHEREHTVRADGGE